MRDKENKVPATAPLDYPKSDAIPWQAPAIVPTEWGHNVLLNKTYKLYNAIHISIGPAIDEISSTWRKWKTSGFRLFSIFSK